ncbi:MAG: hypothetical protein IT514_08565 [Burkholderiales bacterium]|nr:hypothetical protein [Burkholderiales bacterium]
MNTRQSEPPSDIGAGGASAAQPRQVWDLVNPEGAIRVTPLKLGARPESLRGKTVVLRWNGKHNGNVFLERVGEQLAEQVEGIRIVKAWETVPESLEPTSTGQQASMALAGKILALKPDLVIGSQGD